MLHKMRRETIYMPASERLPTRRQLPKLMACMTKVSMENLRNRLLFGVDFLDAKGIRRRKQPLHECLILEMREAGFADSSTYLNDLLYDNAQLVAEDDIGIVVDLRKREDYLEHICAQLQIAEKERDRDNAKKECLIFLNLAMDYAEKGKGILWLAEKFFLASIAVASKYMIDGGRQKGCCKYHYGKFLLDKFPGADTEEPYNILAEVRDSSIGKPWKLYEPAEDQEEAEVPPDLLFCASAIQLHRVLLAKSREVRKQDPARSERLARLAERRAKDADEASLTAEAIIEVGICQLIMNNLNNAQKTFDRAFKIYTAHNDINGLCETRMHMAAVMQRLGEFEKAALLLTEMGALAMDHLLTRQLGRALHLLGELHLRRERPELGTQHLTEAFFCFLGKTSQFFVQPEFTFTSKKSGLNVIFEKGDAQVYEEEAEQSRLMMAISAGQELMASYFILLRKARTCAVAKTKVIEWKLTTAGWWVKRPHHALMPCLCSRHQRSPLDVLWTLLNQKEMDKENKEGSSTMALGRNFDIPNFQEFRNSSYNVRDSLSNVMERNSNTSSVLRSRKIKSIKSASKDKEAKEGKASNVDKEGKEDKTGEEGKEVEEPKRDEINKEGKKSEEFKDV